MFFVRFVRFFFSTKKYILFRPHVYIPISALTRLSHTGQKCVTALFCNNVHTQNFYEHVTVCLVQKWTYRWAGGSST